MERVERPLKRRPIVMCAGKQSVSERGVFQEALEDCNQAALLILRTGIFPLLLWGQIINLSLTMPQNASFSLSLYPPYSASSVGTQGRQGSVRTLCYVAGDSGDWYVRVGRNSGRGEYTLSLSLAEQNDAGSGRDAGNVRWKVLSISPGTWKGFLKAADSEDWYTFPVEQGQRMDVSLTMP